MKLDNIPKNSKQDHVQQQQLTYFRECLSSFQTFTEPEWQLFCSCLTFQELKKSEVIIAIDEVCKKMLFICEGAIRYFVNKDGETITSYFSFKGEVGAAYASFISGTPTMVGLQAIQRTQLLLLSKKRLDLLSADPAIGFKIEQMRRRIAEHLILCYDERTRTFLMQSPEERYLNLLNAGGEIFQRIPQHYIANYLGITAVSLSRIRNRSMSKT